MTKTIEYGISWDAFKTRKWMVFEMSATGTKTLLTFDTRNEANAALAVLNSVPLRQRAKVRS